MSATVEAVENVQCGNYVSKFENSYKSMSAPSSRKCFGGTLLLTNENDKNLIEESIRS